MSLDLDQIVADAQAAFAAANDNATLENEKARFLGKTGALT
ncbi:MAG: phenylalanine--tRNA ligase subunit alpha, partial [Cupriavidus sp.]|nr:phenylalanine--tRNA ligase subunit alpha [Cupriavidus sp.]